MLMISAVRLRNWAFDRWDRVKGTQIADARNRTDEDELRVMQETLLYAERAQVAFELDRFPSFDAELVVRCRDCRHYHAGHDICYFWGDGCETSPDGYCWRGERKTDD